jgi:hypothetical protein
VAVWSREDGHPLEPYGVDISPRLADLARRRCPQWADRVWAANALGWTPPRRFTYVRTGLDYVPPPRRTEYVDHLLTEVVEAGGRLVVGVFNEERDQDGLAALVASWGFPVAGRTSRPHRHPAVAYKAFWGRRPPSPTGGCCSAWCWRSGRRAPLRAPVSGRPGRLRVRRGGAQRRRRRLTAAATDQATPPTSAIPRATSSRCHPGGEYRTVTVRPAAPGGRSTVSR